MSQELILKATKIAKKLVFIAMIVLTIAVILISVVDYREAMKEDKIDYFGPALCVNLVADALVMVWGYLIIDRLIKRQEEQRWLSVKCLLYARLLEIVDEFLAAVLPEGFCDTRSKIYKYKYGDIYATSLIELPEKERLSCLPSLIEQDIERHGSFDITPLSQTRDRLDVILDRSGFRLDPEPLDLLLRLRFVFLSSVPTDIDWTDKDSREEFAYWFTGVISAAFEVRTWLERMLKQHFVIEDVTSG